MRIVCQKCSSAYAIDDKFVTSKGVRAQCPRCRHLQLVKRDEPAQSSAPAPQPPPVPPPMPSQPGQRAPVSPPPAPTPFLFDLSAPPVPPSAGRSSVSSPAPFAFDFAAPPPSGSAPAPIDLGPAPPSGPSRGGQPAQGFDFGELQPPPPPVASSPSGSSFDFGGFTAPSGTPVPEPDAALLDFVSAPTAVSSTGTSGVKYPVAPGAPDEAETFQFGMPPPPQPGSTPLCKSCNKPLLDPFDQALGTCDECRNKVASDPTPEGEVEASSKVERVSSGEIQAKLKAAQEPKPSVPPPPAPVFGASATKQEPATVRSAARERPTWNAGRTIGIILGLAVAVGLSVYFVIKRPWARKAPTLVAKHDTSPRPVEGIIQQWRLNYPELAGESVKKSKDYVELGETLISKDTTGAYRDAEEAFRKALVLDPSSDRAIAGWALVLAFGRDAQIDDATAKAAESMLMTAEQRNGEPRVYVAHAHLLIARGGNPNDIRVLAERGKSSPNPSDKALAALAIGQTLLTKNPQLASAAFRESLGLDPKLKRAYFSQSQLAASLGNYKEAIEDLEHRLELDKDQWEAAEGLARLYVDVGELARARKVLETAKEVLPSAGRPRLTLAMLDYQHLGELAKAEGELLSLTTASELPASERAEAWMHIGTVRRLLGEPDKAAQALEQALDLRPDLSSARLQKFLVLIDRGVLSSARLELDALKGKLKDPSLEGLLEGRLLLAENRLDEALKALTDVADGDARRADAVLLAGAAAAKARKDGKAWELCLRRGLKVDPHSRPVPSLTQLYVRPADLLKAAVGAFEHLSPTSEEDPNPSLCEGLVAWYLEDLPSADRAFGRVNTIDPRNADAYAFRALIALARKDTVTAQRLASRGADASKTNALVYAALGLAELQANRPEAAKSAATSSLKQSSSLLLGKTVLGEATARTKDPEEARRILTSVLLADPLYRDAKRVLYKQQL